MVRTFGLTHIGLAVRDVERSVRFYETLLGAKVTYRGRAGTVGFFVLWPFDWDRKPAGA